MTIDDDMPSIVVNSRRRGVRLQTAAVTVVQAQRETQCAGNLVVLDERALLVSTWDLMTPRQPGAHAGLAVRQPTCHARGYCPSYADAAQQSATASMYEPAASSAAARLQYRTATTRGSAAPAPA